MTPETLSSAPKARSRLNFDSVWEAISAPHSSITSPNDRRQARLVAGVLFSLLVLFCLEAFFVPTRPFLQPLIWPIVATTSGLTIAYILCRQRYITVAAVLGLSVVALSVLGQVFSIPATANANPLASLVWLSLPILLSGLLLPPRSILLIAAVIIVALVLATIALPDFLPSGIRGVLIGFLSTVAIVIATVRYVQERYLFRPQLLEVQQAEKALRRKNAELERANKEIRDFAYIVAHDLRAPLVNLTGFLQEAELAVEDMQPAITAGLPTLDESTRQQAQMAAESDLPEALAFLQSSSGQMQTLVDQVLRIARVGKHELHTEPINLHTMTEQIRYSFSHQMTDKAVSIRLRSLPTVQADPVFVQQVVSNLLDNAIKYLDPHRPGEIEVFGEADDDEWIIHVRDNGRGIAVEDYDRVFQLFRRARNTDGVSGEGIGLPYIQSIIQRLGGRIWFESALDKGSVFSFSLPKTISEHIAA
jgi:signal transduction histidine kinase